MRALAMLAFSAAVLGALSGCKDTGVNGRLPPEYTSFIGKEHLTAIMRTERLLTELEPEVRAVRTDIAVANLTRERPDRVAADTAVVNGFLTLRQRVDRLRMANQETWRRALADVEAAERQLKDSMTSARALLARPAFQPPAVSGGVPPP